VSVLSQPAFFFMRAFTPALLLMIAASYSVALSSQTVGEQAADSQTFIDAHLPRPAAVSAEVTRRVRDLVGRMTLREKVGQMTQLEIGMVTDGKDADLQVNAAKLRKAVVDYGVGSILNVKDLALPIAKWHELVSAIQAAAADTRLKVPVVYGIDSIHGANYVVGATLFPQPLGMAATWNPQLMLQASRITAAETRAAGIPWNFSPVLDIGRQPLWPRLYETFGEDVHLASVMAVATVRGYQGDDPASAAQVAACLKHFIGYSLPVSGHDRTPALIPGVALREYFLPTFAAGVKAGALSVMVNSGEVNGVAGHANRFLLTDVLRGELGFDGVVVSDWEDIKKLVTFHHAAASEKEATRVAVLAGIDMSMVPSDYSFPDLLVQLVNDGAVPMARIDEAVSRVLTMKARLGLFDDPLRGVHTQAAVGSVESRRVALAAARESLVLLKNDGAVLPLSPTTRILVVGPTADSLPALNNGWTITWQGDRPAEYPKDRPTIRRALEARGGANRVSYVAGQGDGTTIDVAAAVSSARSADVVVLSLGEQSYAETPGDIDDLALPDGQVQLAQALAATGKPLVLVLVEGRPRIIRTIADAMKGIVLALNPGLEGGTAIAEVLFGDVNPSGRLPISYPRSVNALTTYDHKWSEEQDHAFRPQFAFGSGLSYTTFNYRDLEVSPGAASAADAAIVSLTVANSGTRAGADVVQLFVAQRTSATPPPVMRLKRFQKVALEPGAHQDVRFRLTRDDFSSIGTDEKRRVEPGTFTIRVGGLTRDLTVR